MPRLPIKDLPERAVGTQPPEKLLDILGRIYPPDMVVDILDKLGDEKEEQHEQSL